MRYLIGSVIVLLGGLFILMQLRKPGEKGLGDTLARIFSGMGIKKSEGCGCEARQSALNRLCSYS